jgi:hypothetical protein
MSKEQRWNTTMRKSQGFCLAARMEWEALGLAFGVPVVKHNYL